MRAGGGVERREVAGRPVSGDVVANGDGGGGGRGRRRTTGGSGCYRSWLRPWCGASRRPAGSGGRGGRTWCRAPASAGGDATPLRLSCGHCRSPGISCSRPRWLSEAGLIFGEQTSKIYDNEPPCDSAKASSTCSIRCFGRRRLSPLVSCGNFYVGQVSYKYNLLKSRGPRSMFCTLECPSIQETWEKSLKMKFLKRSGTTVLRNKAPWWHEHLQCWCLNFHGWVTVACVKNFQLVATTDPSHPDSFGDEETVILQFGKPASLSISSVCHLP